MIDEMFYGIIDNQIQHMKKTYKNNVFLKRQKDENNKNSFCFLLWFLNNYLPTAGEDQIEKYITEGDDDTSCDLIFKNTDQRGEVVYYVVQSKWFTKANINKTKGTKKEIKACVSDFKLILSGKKKTSVVNENFNERYSEFLKHKKINGKIKFVYVVLNKATIDALENIDDLNTELVTFELINFDKLKNTHIEIYFKDIKTHNPLEEPYIPSDDIPLTFLKNKSLAGPDNSAYIFFVKPVEIYRLFEKYKFSLFYKNIRNPLKTSLYNKEIVNTLRDNPSYFWYFNNGITGITDNIYPFHRDADNVTIKGIQIINGAQTVYSIYDAYHQSTPNQRTRIDENAIVTFRILKTGSKEFDLKVTRFTNSQNPIYERDFHSNDDIQKHLQDIFYQETNIWFETRRGEFRKKIRGVNIVANEAFAQTYLAFKLQDPYSAKQFKRLLFVSKDIDENGLYENVFNNSTRVLDLYVSYLLHKIVEHKRKDYKSLDDDKYAFVQYATFEIIALYDYFMNHICAKNADEIKNKCLQDIERDNSKITLVTYEFLVKGIMEYMVQLEKKEKIVYSVWFKSKDCYKNLKDHFASIFESKIKDIAKLKRRWAITQ